MLKKFQTRRGAKEEGSSGTSGSSDQDADEPVLIGKEGKGALLYRSALGKWKPFWFENNGDTLMQFAKRGTTKPKTVIRLTAAILKSADELVGEEFTFALFVPQKDPHYFRASNQEQKSMWMGILNKHCASTEWSTSSMVTAFVDPVCVASQEGIIIEVNDAMLSLFGYQRQQVIGKNLKILMPASVAQHHDSYIKAYLTTGIAKLVGKPRQLMGQHADGSPLPLILSLGVESAAGGKKTFIATLRTDKEKKNVPSKVELDALMHKAVDNTLQEATTKIKEALSGELDQIMKRLEDYQASYKLLAAKGLKGSRPNNDSSIDDHDNSDLTESQRNTQKPGKAELTIDSSNMQVGHRLGLGGSGCAVYSCNVDGWECAMKELKIANAKQSDIDAFMAEIFLLESLPPHKNLVRFLFHQKTSDRIRVFMRRYESTLDVYLKARREKDEYLDVSDVGRLALDVVRALEILHDYKVIHRDVKSQNLFVNHDMAGNVSHLTLSDFDSAKVVENAAAAKTVIGTIGWMPPEVYSSAGKSYSFSADVWSFGMVLFELMDLGRPFDNVDEFDRAAYIGAGNLPKFRNPDVSDKRYSAILPVWKKCCSLKPDDRPLLRDIKVDLSHIL